MPEETIKTTVKNAQKEKTDQKKDFEQIQKERIFVLQGLNLFSDVFMSVTLNDIGACQHVLRVLTGNPGLVIKKVKTQYRISRIVSRDVQLDVLAEGSDGSLYTAEIQKKNTVDHARRTRFHEAMIDSEYLAKGKDFHDLPELHVIYISRTDLWRRKRASCKVERKIEENEEEKVSDKKKKSKRKPKEYTDGQHILYVNAAVDDGTETAKLMKYFLTADPDDMSQGALSKRVRYLKKEEGGQKIMCEVMDRIREEGRREGRREGREKERANTLRERSRANREKIRADEAERKLREMKAEIIRLQVQIAGGKNL